MLFNEPAPTGYDLRFRIFDIPVRVHPMFWLITVLMGANDSEPLRLVAWIAAVFASILVHELGHAAVLRAFGHRPWIVLYGMGGLACHQPGSRGRGSGTLAQIAVSAAGPGAGFALAAVLALLLQALGKPVRIEHYGYIPFPQTYVATILGLATPRTFFGLWSNDVFWVSVFWGVVNLLPVYPLDGGNISREICTAVSPRRGIAVSLGLSALVAAGIAAHQALNFHGSGDFYVMLLFGYLAYASFVAFEAYQSRRPW